MTEQTYLLMHRHINGYGRLFGGQLMQWIDELAGIVSMRHAGGRITTASIDNLNFKAGAYLNDTIVLIGRITYVGRTSMEVRVDTYVEDQPRLCGDGGDRRGGTCSGSPGTDR